MAEVLSPSSRYFNQFKNRSLAETTAIYQSLSGVTILTQNITQVTDSVSSVTQSINYISQSLETQNLILDELSATADALNPNKIFVNKEIPSGSIDGVNTIYTLSHVPTQGSDHLYLNGLLIEENSNTDYTISGSTIKFNEPLLSGSKLHCTYYYIDLTPLRVFKDKETPLGLIDGTNKVFTLKYTPVENSEHIYLNGVLQDNGETNDYIISGSTITFKEAPLYGMKLRCTYYYMF